LSAEGFKTRLRGVLDPLVRLLADLGVAPGAITAAGLFLSAVAALMLAAGSFGAAGLVLLLSGLCDVLDGMVARACGGGTRFGAVADSSADRYGEGFVLGGLLYYYGTGGGARESGPAVSAFLVFASLIGSYMVSYVRARSEGVGAECKVGLMERPERLTLVIAGALLGPGAMTVLLWPLALLANATAIHRLLAVRDRLARDGADAATGDGTRPPVAGGVSERSAVSPEGGAPRPALTFEEEGELAPGAVRPRPDGEKVPGGFFVTLEGVEGSGKSTQARRLVGWLAATGYDVLGTREPGGTEAGERIRRVLLGGGGAGLRPEAELLLYLADRAQHVRDVIRPALQSGAVVVCDRFSDATLAYQAGGRGLPEETVRDLNELAAGGLSPHLTLVLDLPEADGLARAAGRGGGFDRMEREAISFHRDVRSAYLEIAKREPDRVRVVDASRTEEEIEREIVAIVEEALRARAG